MRSTYESTSLIGLLLKMKSHDDITFPWYHGENHAKKTLIKLELITLLSCCD